VKIPAIRATAISPPHSIPIADAHYAMALAFLYEATGDFSPPGKADIFS